MIAPSFTCPRCQRTSHCPEDAAVRYCGACRLFFDDCPSCGLLLPDWDFIGQADHMTTTHPEIIAERQGESARWDGWEN